MYRNNLNFFVFLFVIFCTASCVNTQKSTYFNNAQDANITTALNNVQEVTIQKNDILSIIINSLNPEASAIFNAANTAAINYTTTGTFQSTGGYLVNSEGFIQLPILGNINVLGLTKKKLKEQITATLVEKKLLIDPIVSIRHLNFEVTVIGEVGKPSVITVPSEQLSLLKALGLAGDITIYGSKDNVLLIRESNGKRLVKRINLNSTDFLTSSYYYLQPNDVLYVEANKNRIASASRTRQILPIVLSSLSIVVIVLDRLIK